MDGHNPSTHHRINLLSVWREDGECETCLPKLRLRLEDPRTGEQQVYPSLGMLLTALEKILLDIPVDIKM